MKKCLNSRKIDKINYKRYLISLKRKDKSKQTEKNTFNGNLSHICSKWNFITPKSNRYSSVITLMIPQKFSLIDNYQVSLEFIVKTFGILLDDNYQTLRFSYKECKEVNIDALTCLDIIVRYFIKSLAKKNRKISTGDFQSPDISKIIFSVGSYNTILGKSMDFKDVTSFSLKSAYSKKLEIHRKVEVFNTEIVDYVVECLSKMNHEVNFKFKENLSKVAGEILSNACDHSTTGHFYLIGYFKESNSKEDGHLGMFYFTIMNFGDTIYETFKNGKETPTKVVEQMQKMSEKYTKKKFFKPAEFEEETLWTLYALQECVTSKPTKRGNGSIKFIENFFGLKGNQQKDNISKMAIMSGNTQIIFDGTYGISENIITENEKE